MLDSKYVYRILSVAIFEIWEIFENFWFNFSDTNDSCHSVNVVKVICDNFFISYIHFVMLRWKSEDDGLPTNLDVINRVISVQPIHLMHFSHFHSVFLYTANKNSNLQSTKEKNPQQMSYILPGQLLTLFWNMFRKNKNNDCHVVHNVLYILQSSSTLLTSIRVLCCSSPSSL